MMTFHCRRRAMLNWITILTIQIIYREPLQISAFALIPTTTPSHSLSTPSSSSTSQLSLAKKGFSSSTVTSNIATDKQRQKSIDGLQDWAKNVGILYVGKQSRCKYAFYTN